jgi:hypothetical protein
MSISTYLVVQDEVRIGRGSPQARPLLRQPMTKKVGHFPAFGAWQPQGMDAKRPIARWNAKILATNTVRSAQPAHSLKFTCSGRPRADAGLRCSPAHVLRWLRGPPPQTAKREILTKTKPMTATAVIQSPFAAPAHGGSPWLDRSTRGAAADRSAPAQSGHTAAPGVRRNASDSTRATMRVIRTARRRCVRLRDLDTISIRTRNNAPDVFARFISRGFICYGIELRTHDEPGMPPQHEGALPVATAPATAPADAKEVTP